MSPGKILKNSACSLLLLLLLKNIKAQTGDTLIYPDEKHFKNIQQVNF